MNTTTAVKATVNTPAQFTNLLRRYSTTVEVLAIDKIEKGEVVDGILLPTYDRAINFISEEWMEGVSFRVRATLDNSLETIIG